MAPHPLTLTLGILGIMTPSTACCLWFLDPGNVNKGKQQLCAMPAAALDRTHSITTFDSGAWLQAFRHHHGEQVQVGEMKERERGRTVHGLGREADMKR